MSNAWTIAPTLIGTHTTLRPLVMDDRDSLVAAAADGDITELFFTNVANLRDPDAYMSAIFKERDFGRAMPFAVEVAGRVVGMTRYMRMNAAHRRLEIGGTFYARSVQRSGVNTEAKLLLLTHAFEDMGCNVVQIRTDWFNKRSQTAIERLGAKRDGVLRNHQLMDGRIRDLVVYSIIASEWAGVKQNLNFLLQRHKGG
ncbi:MULTISPECIES: GNAT family N-acetyltransferase [unclassified Sphingomonas]|uniref:GNAT family N-acetyltransferase n=1 Tax=unclassified Sphingomonas TaxID=196159 RepID=UPI000BDAC8C3|nr:MAG: GNAT family N-acetyltransferase [Sphingomonas sp. 12-62-6]OYX39695.1 MAG: GNAT family N-acetyltransferase [Sphingomonas sp. 32-62-10]OYY65605.1 MAG: GNAT family N-acetyltransferase [Sphingomonas sp. 28-62-11]